MENDIDIIDLIDQQIFESLFQTAEDKRHREISAQLIEANPEIYDPVLMSSPNFNSRVLAPELQKITFDSVIDTATEVVKEVKKYAIWIVAGYVALKVLK